jgi:hypothetical protein
VKGICESGRGLHEEGEPGWPWPACGRPAVALARGTQDLTNRNCTFTHSLRGRVREKDVQAASLLVCVTVWCAVKKWRWHGLQIR